MLIFPTYQTMLAKAAATSSGGSSIVTTDLISHWDFGNSSSYSSGGTSITDLSGNSNGGTIVAGANNSYSNISYSSDNGGHIILTNDGADSATFTRTDLFKDIGTDDFTLEFWWNPYWESSRSNEGYMSLLANTPMSNGYNENVRIQIRAGKIRVSNWFTAVGTQTSGSWTYIDSSAVYTNNDYHGWEHLVFSRIGTGNNNTKMYRNNSLIETWTNKADYDDAYNTSDSNAKKSLLSSLVPAGANYAYRGKFAIFRFYIGTGLTSSEVTTNWNAQKSRFGH